MYKEKNDVFILIFPSQWNETPRSAVLVISMTRESNQNAIIFMIWWKYKVKFKKSNWKQGYFCDWMKSVIHQGVHRHLGLWSNQPHALFPRPCCSRPHLACPCRGSGPMDLITAPIICQGEDKIDASIAQKWGAQHEIKWFLSHSVKVALMIWLDLSWHNI